MPDQEKIHEDLVCLLHKMENEGDDYGLTNYGGDYAKHDEEFAKLLESYELAQARLLKHLKTKTKEAVAAGLDREELPEYLCDEWL